ncbi:MAG: redoxin domain-containing protein [Acidimicrobiia bacterium]|nr:redoxin domain-containing protein [Acidimicrobiia bacterium]NNL69429.1 redoxin domain-containing protein [Acidimicrobiia bacterium]
MSVSIGQVAPDFSLPDQTGEAVSRADLTGSRALIVFIPFPFTSVCDGEVCAIRDNFTDLSDLNARVVVITCHARPTNARWASEHSLNHPVLSDFWPHGAVATEYGVFNEQLGVATRSTFVLDENGVVRDIISSESLGAAREHDAYAAALAAV